MDNENCTSDLFDNPMVRQARRSMPPEQIEKFERIGREMYANIDYETSTVNGHNFPKTVVDSAALTIEGIKSGLHPSDLSGDEQRLLSEVYGKTWYARFGYTERDLHELYTFVFKQ